MSLANYTNVKKYGPSTTIIFQECLLVHALPVGVPEVHNAWFDLSFILRQI